MPRRLALLVATYRYQDAGLRQLTAPGHDAEALAEVLRNAEIADFDVTILVNEPHHVVGRAIGEFYRNRRRDDLTLLYFTGHGLKDDEGRLYLAMTNTTRDDLLFTALSAQQVDDAMESCLSRQKILVLDCCYSGAFPAGRISKADAEVHTLEKFQGKGRVVLTASDATQYSFEGNHITGQGTRSVFTRFLVEGLTTGKGDLDEDGDISLDELYSYVYDRVIEEMPQQRPKKQENVEGRIVIARNIHWSLPVYVRSAIESPFARDRLVVLEGLVHLYRVGNDLVRAEVINQARRLIHDDSKVVSAAAIKLITALNPDQGGRAAEEQGRREAEEPARREAEELAAREAEEPRWEPAVSLSPRHSWTGKQDETQVVPSPYLSLPVDDTTARSGQLERETPAGQYTQAGAATEKQTPQQDRREAEEHTLHKANEWTGQASEVPRRPVGPHEPPILKPPTQLPPVADNTTPRSTAPVMGLTALVPRSKVPLILGVACVVIVVAVASAILFALLSSDDTIVGKSISVGAEPNDVEVGEGSVWTANRSSGTISRVNPRDATSREIKVGGNPTLLEADQGAVWVWNYSDGITRVDVRTGEVSRPITGGSPDALISGFAVGGGYVWLSHSANGTVTRINMQTQALEGDPIAVGPKPTAMAFGDKLLYVVNSGDNTISTLDGSTGAVLGIPLKVNQELGRCGACLEVHDGVIYVGTIDDVTPIDERYFIIGEPIPLKGYSHFTASGGSAWVVYPLDNVVRRIDLQTRQPRGEPIKGIGRGTGDIAFADDVLWVSNSKQNTVTEIRPGS
ncbi:MAG: caspase, EACC1-associated type [Pseudonocardiaceae bacterium]